MARRVNGRVTNQLDRLSEHSIKQKSTICWVNWFSAISISGYLISWFEEYL